MTVPDLIAEVLSLVRNQHYADRVREFKRDERSLTKAIARYGFECERRGWLFEPRFIFRELAGLLLKIKTSGIEIKYLPVYLEGAVDRHIRLRAEELAEEAKAKRAVPVLMRRAVAGVQPVQVVAPTAVEVLATVYRDLKSRQRTQRRTRAASVRVRQEVLL